MPEFSTCSVITASNYENRVKDEFNKTTTTRLYTRSNATASVFASEMANGADDAVA